MKAIIVTHMTAGKSVLDVPPEKDCTLLICGGTGGSTGELLFQRGMAALIFPNMPYSMTLTPGSDVYLIRFPTALLPELLRQKIRQSPLLLPDPGLEFLQYSIATWSMLNASPADTPQFVFDSSLAALLSWVTLLSQESRQQPAGAHSRQLVEQAKSILSTEYATDLSLQSVADRLFVNPCYLSTVFHQSTGVTFREYLKTVRLRKTKQLLAETNYLITDIAMQTGWGSTAYLIRSFRQTYGITPNAYRSQHAGKR